MAAELEKFIDQKLSELPLNHPDRKFLRGLKATVSAYVEGTKKTINPEAVYVRTEDTTEDESLGRKISEAFLGSLSNDTSIHDIRSHFGSKQGRWNPKVTKGPFADKWEEIYRDLTADEKRKVTRTFNWFPSGIKTLGQLRGMTQEEIGKICHHGTKRAALLKASITPIPNPRQV